MTHSCRRGRCYKADTPVHEELCKYGYPFPVTPQTYINDRGRVQFRRRSEADESVVSYNPTLTLKYNAHLNVDLCHTTM
jgi:hypothetical protein